MIFINRLLLVVLCLFVWMPAFAVNKGGVSVMVAGDVPKIKPGLEVNGFFFGVTFFYNYYDKLDYIPNSKLYEFDNALYSYSVKGTRDIFGIRWDFIDWQDGSSVGANLSSFYLGYGRNTIKGEMTITKINATNSNIEKQTFDVISKFTINSYMIGLFATSVSRIAIDFRLRYDVADIPIVHEETEKKISGENLTYRDFYPEILIGWSY